MAKIKYSSSSISSTFTPTMSLCSQSSASSSEKGDGRLGGVLVGVSCAVDMGSWRGSTSKGAGAGLNCGALGGTKRFEGAVATGQELASIHWRGLS